MRGSATLAIVVSSADMIDASMSETVMSVRRPTSISSVCGGLLNATPYPRSWVRLRPPVSDRCYAYRQLRRHLSRLAKENLHPIGQAGGETERARTPSP